MSKEGEISKHVDPSLNRQESIGEQASAMENGANGHFPGQESTQGSEDPDQLNQVSHEDAMAQDEAGSSVTDQPPPSDQAPKTSVSGAESPSKTPTPEASSEVESRESSEPQQREEPADLTNPDSSVTAQAEPTAASNMESSSLSENRQTTAETGDHEPKDPKIQKKADRPESEEPGTTAEPQPENPQTQDVTTAAVPETDTSAQEKADRPESEEPGSTAEPQPENPQAQDVATAAVPETDTSAQEKVDSAEPEEPETTAEPQSENPQAQDVATDTAQEPPDGSVQKEHTADANQPNQQVPAKPAPVKPWEGKDFKQLDKSELVKIIEVLVNQDDPLMAEKVARKLKSRYNFIHQQDREQALGKFVEEGNDPDHFAYKFDELDNRFDGAFKLIRDRKYQYVKNLEKDKEKNLAEKVNLLEELRGLVDDEETTSSIHAVKQIQEKWKNIGQVPGQHVKTLWANYHALMDRYYDQRSIYFELKELDRKKNLEVKLELCERAEKLVDLENLKQAINELNELHEEFKHVGPVPKEDQQALWERFKGASDQVYARRKKFIKHLKHDLKENLLKKRELAEEVQQFKEFDSQRINDWNKKTREVLEVQKKWEAVGGLPRDQAKEVNRRFWGAFKGFFHNKGLFFKQLEGERMTNLQKKQELVAEAEGLKDSTDWNETAEKLKGLQQQWRAIGPVPEKHRNAIYQQFKEACDEFFTNLRAQNQDIEKEYIENLKKKQQICMQIETMTTAGDHDLDAFLDLKLRFEELGYVPAGEVKNIRSQFLVASNDFLASVPGELKEEARQIKYDIEFEKLKKGPHSNRKIEQKEQTLRREIGTLENDIATWKNNLEFFANSKTADKLKEEFTVKIDQAVRKLKELKSQLRAVREL
ncbi:MAG: hypothetical protein DHS20C17_09020 [Cyclobacteriaceae bacterium]|nr:MAG: hypothetical protein DHS20C17_09020 [Cyclobacteriaceae bacterium]